MTKEVIYDHNSTTPRLHFSSSPSSSTFFYLFQAAGIFFSFSPAWLFIGKSIQCRGNSPRRACNLGLKESARPGELDASLGKFMARNLHEMTILPFLKALFLDPSNNYKKPTKSRMNLSYLSNNISKYTIYIINQIHPCFYRFFMVV